MAFTLSVRNYRGLRRVEWSPSGVCALVGPNGSGKTTLIDVLRLLRDAYGHGFTRAMEMHGGAYGLRHFAAPPDEPITFALRCATASWEFQPEVSIGLGGARLPVREKLIDNDTVLLERKQEDDAEGRFSSALLGDRLLLQGIRSPNQSTESIWKIVWLLVNYQHYRHYALQALRREGSLLGGDLVLQQDGRNLFAVLLNWRNRRDYRERWDFVFNSLNDCFPGLVSDFSFPIAANIVSCEVYTPQGQSLTPALLPDGFLVALLHLCAVASADNDGVLAIDEAENALHPHAIRRLMDAFREWSDARDVTVLLATHSPVVLDTFKELPEKVFVMEPEQEVLPVPLDQLKKRSWLSHFSLGDLYEHLEYGAPAQVEPE
ncbi:MAG TPA: AAA family ATPase [Archangium sp.]|nr:AAA family ATPase [Archangium sp.]